MNRLTPEDEERILKATRAASYGEEPVTQGNFLLELRPYLPVIVAGLLGVAVVLLFVLPQIIPEKKDPPVEELPGG